MNEISYKVSVFGLEQLKNFDVFLYQMLTYHSLYFTQAWE